MKAVLLWLCLVFALPFGGRTQSVTTLTDWEFRREGASEWLPATVPGVVQQDLLQQGLIPDPAWGTNADSCLWIEDHRWEYRTRFPGLTPEPGMSVELVFAGLDTYAEVYLNGELLLSADNQFVQWTISLNGRMQDDNELLIRFTPPVRYHRDRPKWPPYHLTAGNDVGEEQVSVYSRKAQYHFGWDWAPRMTTLGIWKPAYLKVTRQAALHDVQVYQKMLTDHLAVLEVVPQVEVLTPGHYDLVVRNVTTGEVRKYPWQGADTLLVEINRPQRWWPNGMGTPFLYELEVALWSDTDLLGKITRQIGLRTLRLVQEADTSCIRNRDGAVDCRLGTSFFFEINGVPLFARGANYVPMDVWLPRVPPARKRALLVDAARANCNMLRVWGGGIYESDAFYRWCDSLGILVWQDFMFACGMYPADSLYTANVRREATQQILRLRNHPSVAFWCGNNEVLMGWQNWGWQATYGIHGADSVEMWQAYKRLFRELLPGLVDQLDAGRPYTESSPLSNWGTLDNFFSGSMHYWGVWHGGDDFSGYERFVGRFVSEYGFQSFPGPATVASFAPADAWNLEAPVMRYRQKSYVGNEEILRRIGERYRPPKDFGDFLYKSQLAQRDGMRRAIRAHRLNRGHCMGTLFWQLNDVWAGPSWSAVDFFGRKKAFYHDLPGLYAPFLIVPFWEEDTVRVSIVADHRDTLSARLELQCLTPNGKLLWEKKQEVELPAGGVRHLAWQAPDPGSGKAFLRIRLWSRDSLLAQTPAFREPGHARRWPGSRIKVRLHPEAKLVELTATSLVRDLFLRTETGVRFERNFVDLLPGERVQIPYTGVIREEQEVILHSWQALKTIKY